jgi:hypothetical protein
MLLLTHRVEIHRHRRRCVDRRFNIMQHPRSLALPAALCLLVAGACQDAPLGPRAPARASVIASPRQVPIVAFSGRAADSVMELLEPTWYSLGPSLSGHARADWRIRNNVPAHITDALLPSNVGTPNALVTSGGTSVPQILSHFEEFYFGRHDQTSSTPSGVEAEMTFIADQGQITLASLTVTPDSGGAQFLSSGLIAAGVGDITNCSDVSTGGCYQHHLSGVTTLSSAPDCNAHASGTVGYAATISQTSLGFSLGSTTSSGQTVSSSAPVSATAPACSSTSTTTGSQTDSTTTPYGSTSGPPPAPTGPNVPTAPPPPEAPVSGAGGGFVCQRTDLYQVIGASRTLLSTTIDCYPD